MAHYERGEVRVDNDFARFGSKSYAINKINSVEVREESPHSLALCLIFGFLAAIIAMASLNPFSVGGILTALVCAAISYWGYERAQRRLYKLFLMTSSSEAQALQSANREEVNELREAIEGAMTAR